MSDLDFDELDQAVASAMGGDTPQAKPVVAEKSSTTVPVASSAPVIHAARVATPVAKRSAGRFMDVVHPSSDMRTTKSEPVEQKPVVAEKPAPTNEWPDPLDFHGFTSEEPKKDEPAKVETVIEKVEEDENSPLSSPFLSGTKPEKRPLGAFSPTGKSETPKNAFELPAFNLPNTLKEEKSDDDDEKEIVIETKKADQPLPAELQGDLLSVESDASLTETTSSELSPDTVKAPSTVNEVVAEEPEKNSFFNKKEKTEVPPVPSIVQQYKERAASVDQPSGAIYDTETYHKPMVTMPGKKTGLLVVLWILGLIIIGGGLGAAAYFFVLPLLV